MERSITVTRRTDKFKVLTHDDEKHGVRETLDSIASGEVTRAGNCERSNEYSCQVMGVFIRS
jgi:hypothetical protein